MKLRANSLHDNGFRALPVARKKRILRTRIPSKRFTLFIAEMRIILKLVAKKFNDFAVGKTY